MKRSAVVIAVCVIGALGGLWIGILSAFFADAGPLARACYLFWGVLGGACVGASPGGIAALTMGHRWPLPVFGGAAGGVAAVMLDETPVFPSDKNVAGLLYAASVLVGLSLGGVAWLLKRKQAVN